MCIECAPQAPQEILVGIQLPFSRGIQKVCDDRDWLLFIQLAALSAIGLPNCKMSVISNHSVFPFLPLIVQPQHCSLVLNDDT
jgi:hypothetical protein